MNPSIKSKLPNTGQSIFTIMSQMASDHQAINLSQGFPDFSSDPELISLVNKYMKEGKNQYAPTQGLIGLREEISGKTEKMNGLVINPISEVNITSGATEAIYAAITASVHEGDEVIVFEPAYDCYVPTILLNGGIPIFVHKEAPDYTINWDLVKNRISNKTRMIIINSPHNPTGTVWTIEDMKALEKLTAKTDILILSDEVYQHIIFDKKKHESVLNYPSLFERSFVVFSFGKTYHNTGWKLGYCIAPDYLMKEFRRVHQFIVFSSFTPLQHALADFIKKEEAYLGLSSFYQEKRDFFINALKGSRFTIMPASGTYFQLMGFENISEENDMAFAERLTKEHGVASIPVSVFYSKKNDDKVLRFCFAKSKEILEEAAGKLNKI